VNVVHTDTFFACPPANVELSECSFYHTMELPGLGLTSGFWDLRGRVDEYLGHVPLRGARVLEIGPASGFLTVEMEKRGASVVALEMIDGHGLDFVPFPPPILPNEIRAECIAGLRKLKNSFWLAHRLYRSRARVFYGDACHLPDELGSFDVAIMAAVLLHAHAPLRIVSECVKRTKTVVITDLLCEDLEGKGPICRLLPSEENRIWHTWWDFSTSFFSQFLSVMGLNNQQLTFHAQKYHPDAPCTIVNLPEGAEMTTNLGIHHAKFFTIVASSSCSLPRRDATRGDRQDLVEGAVRSVDTLGELPADFDAVRYLELNPDVAAAGMDPVRHYLDYGWREGRRLI
jgi:hypothetical protein